MGVKSTLRALSLLAGTVYAAGPASKCNSTVPTASTNSSSTIPSSAPKLSLVPVSTSRSGGVITASRRIVPQKKLNLAWQTPNNDSAVSIGIDMLNSGVALEDIDDVIAVDCTGQASIAVTFNNTEAFNEALTEWSALNDSFVIITNHMGDCDTELERSFFVADSDTLASFDTNLTIVAQAEKSSLVNTASKLWRTFDYIYNRWTVI